MIEDCKYTLRHLLKSLEDYHQTLDDNYDIDYYKKLLIQKNLSRMIVNVREYLSLPVEKPKKRTLSDIFNKTKEYLKKE